MNERNYKKKYELQSKMISRQSEQIESLKSEVEKLKLECKKKDEIISSVKSLKEELTNNVNEVKKYKEEYAELIDDLRKMKSVMDKDVYNGKWKFFKFLMK